MKHLYILILTFTTYSLLQSQTTKQIEQSTLMGGKGEPTTPYMKPAEQVAVLQQKLIDLYERHEKSLLKVIEAQDKTIAAERETIEILKQWTDAKGKLNRR